MSSIGHLSRVRPSTMVITVSHTVCTRIQPWRRLRHERSRVMRPAPISAVRARSTACRIVSISDSVSTSSFFATRGSASAPMKRNGVQPAKCRNVACTVNAMMNSRRQTIATCSRAAPREPSAFAAISCGARPTMPTQTTIMNSASGKTMPVDHPSALHTGRRLANAKQAVAPRMKRSPARSRARSALTMIRRAKATAPFGVMPPRFLPAPAWR